MNTRILLFASPRLGGFTFDALRQSRHSIVGLVTQPSHLLDENPLAQKAKRNAIPIFTPKTKHELSTLLPTFQTLNPSLIVIAAYGFILPKALIEIPDHGGLNIHFSALPKYRGPAPVPHALLHGEKKIAISIVKLTERIDDGRIIAQHWESIGPEETANTLYARLCPLAADLLVSILPDYLAGRIPGRPQAQTGKSYAPHITRADGKIDILHPPKDLSRRIRAFHSWPGVWTEIEVRGKVRRLKLLPGNLFQLEGKRPVDLSTLLAGYPELAPIFRPIALLLDAQGSS